MHYTTAQIRVAVNRFGHPFRVVPAAGIPRAKALGAMIFKTPRGPHSSVGNHACCAFIISSTISWISPSEQTAAVSGSSATA